MENDKIAITPEMCEIYFFKNGEFKPPTESTNDINRDLYNANLKDKLKNVTVPEGWIFYGNWKNEDLYARLYKGECGGRKPQKQMDKQNLGTIFLVLKPEYGPAIQEKSRPTKKKKTTGDFEEERLYITLGRAELGHYSSDTEIRSLVINWICTKTEQYSKAGRVLMEAVKELAKINGYKNIKLYSKDNLVNPEKAPKGFYKHLSFVEDMEKIKETGDTNYMIYHIPPVPEQEKSVGGKSRKQKLNKRSKRKTHKKK